MFLHIRLQAPRQRVFLSLLCLLLFLNLGLLAFSNGLFFVMGAVLSITGYLVASLASAY